jgi:two-component system chemotaxis response regulator CheB
MSATSSTPKVRVLVVDDSAAIRRLLRSLLETDPGLTVVGTAANGQSALDQIPELKPDVVTLDIEMPVMDGLACLRELRKRWPRLPVIMLSTLTERGAAATLDALAAGASDYVAKPTQFAAANLAVEAIRAHIVPKIKALAERAAVAPSFPGAPPRGPGALAGAPVGAAGLPSLAISHAPAPSAGLPRKPVEVVGIGISTGGPNALGILLPALPADLRVPIVIAQHIPPLFSALMAERLAASSRILVREAKDGEPLQPGTAYIAPGDFHMSVVGVVGRSGGYRISLGKGPPENSCRPAVDVLFRSLAEQVGAGALGIMMTGMGQDGLAGSRLLHAAGGRLLAQDEASSVVWGMPGFVVRAGLVEQVLPLEHLAGALVTRVSPGKAGAGTGAGGPDGKRVMG